MWRTHSPAKDLDLQAFLLALTDLEVQQFYGPGRISQIRYQELVTYRKKLNTGDLEPDGITLSLASYVTDGIFSDARLDQLFGL